jgi:aryl-alcohol dehydrogenase-like predicted oxidoreductase
MTRPDNDPTQNEKEQQFLVDKIFFDLNNQNDGLDEEKNYFSQEHFQTILERVEHYGIGIFTIESYHQGKLHQAAHHEEYRKKATIPQWYKSAFGSMKRSQDNLLYRADFKVPNALLKRLDSSNQ